MSMLSDHPPIPATAEDQDQVLVRECLSTIPAAAAVWEDSSEEVRHRLTVIFLPVVLRVATATAPGEDQ